MLAERRAVAGLYGPAIILAGIGYVLAAVAPNVWVAAPPVVVAGIGSGAAALYNVLLIQRGVPDSYRGRAFTLAMSVTYAMLGPAMAVAGPVTNVLGARWIWAIGAGFSVLAGFVAIALSPRLRVVVAPVDDAELEQAEAAIRCRRFSDSREDGWPPFRIARATRAHVRGGNRTQEELDAVLKTKLNTIIAVTALVVAVFGATPLGHAAERLVLPEGVGRRRTAEGERRQRREGEGRLADARPTSRRAQLPAGPQGPKGDDGRHGRAGGAGRDRPAGRAGSAWDARRRRARRARRATGRAIPDGGVSGYGAVTTSTSLPADGYAHGRTYCPAWQEGARRRLLDWRAVDDDRSRFRPENGARLGRRRAQHRTDGKVAHRLGDLRERRLDESRDLVPSRDQVPTIRRMAKRREWTRETLAAGVRAGDKRALARAITLVENREPLAYDVVRDIYPDTGRSYAVGVTGPPGVGKSSLISALVRHVRGQEQSVGVISVDPSSPFSQGALLGDRIRLSDHFLDPGVFIRSMGSRGHLGGLAEATLQAMLVLDASGKDLLFLETVGAGQGEVEVIGIADTVLLVLMPGSGDSVQALKAGIMEIPDVIAVNKMDHPAAKTMVNEVRSILTLDKEREWKPPIVLTEATRGENVDVLWEKISAHRAFLEERRRARRAAPAEPRRRGVRGRVVAREGAPRARGRRRSRAAAPARRGAAPRARPADGRTRDHGEGVPNWRRKRLRRFVTSRRRASASPASPASRRSTGRRRSPGSPAARSG